jgi:serine/threonine-protein kinase HipA
MPACLVCLRAIAAPQEYHSECASQLFSVRAPPVVDLELAKVHTVAQAMVGHTSISGTQRKVSVGLSTDRATLLLAVEGGEYILKPQAQTFPSLPEIEHVTMRIARAAGIEIPPCGLVHLRDGSLAHLVRRFDRTGEGGKLLQEDFCQLAQLSPKQKYEGSAELCARLVHRYASEPLVEALELYRRVAFAWWTGNGDMHLKNFSLLRGPDGFYRLSPAYDLLCTSLVIEDEQLALPVSGNRKNVTPREWVEYARYCKLTARAAARALRGVRAAFEPGVALIGRSQLPEEMKRRYEAILRKRTLTVERAVQRLQEAA